MRRVYGEIPCNFYLSEGIDASSFETARELAIQIVNAEARRSSIFWTMKRLTSYDKDAYTALLCPDKSEAVLYGSLRVLSELLESIMDRKPFC